MKKIAVFTGAGISAESGISTFRDVDGIVFFLTFVTF
jgi:NAD-dependent SIR2 family protein deacetylase